MVTQAWAILITQHIAPRNFYRDRYTHEILGLFAIVAHMGSYMLSIPDMSLNIQYIESAFFLPQEIKLPVEL